MEQKINSVLDIDKNTTKGKREISWHNNKFIKISTAIELGALGAGFLFFIILLLATRNYSGNQPVGLALLPVIFVIGIITAFLSPLNIIVFFLKFRKADLLDKIFFITNSIIFISWLLIIELSGIFEGMRFFVNTALLITIIVLTGIATLLYLRKSRTAAS